MAKRKRDAAATIERKLTKAQAAFRAAVGKNAKAEKRGTEEIEKARRLAEKRQAKARARVEERQKAVSKLETQLLKLRGHPAATTPEPVAASNGAHGLTDREAQALEALRQVSHDGPAMPGAWQEASRLSNGTFSRVRKALVERGLVAREGHGHQVRYVLVGTT